MAITLLSCEILPTYPRMADVAAMVAERYGLTVDDLRGPSRRRPIVHARQEAMWLMRQVLRPDGAMRFGNAHRYSYPQISLYLGGRDHTTALWGVRQHQARLDRARLARAA